MSEKHEETRVIINDLSKVGNVLSNKIISWIALLSLTYSLMVVGVILRTSSNQQKILEILGKVEQHTKENTERLDKQLEFFSQLTLISKIREEQHKDVANRLTDLEEKVGNVKRKQ